MFLSLSIYIYIALSLSLYIYIYIYVYLFIYLSPPVRHAVGQAAPLPGPLLAQDLPGERIITYYNIVYHDKL